MKRISNKHIFLTLLSLGLFITGCQGGSSNNNNNDDDKGNNDGDTSTTITQTNPSLSNVTLPEEVNYSISESEILNGVTDLDYDSISSNTKLEDYETLSSEGIISEAGNYLLEGEYPNGLTFYVNKNDEVHLFLNNASISSSSNSTFIKSDKKFNLIVTSIEGTTNSITGNYEGKNVIHVKGTLTLNGKGTLNVIGSAEDSNAIKVSSTFAIVDTTLNVTSLKNGIAAESIYSYKSTLNINSSKDGLKSECDFDNSDGETYDFTLESGFIVLKDTSLTINSKGDGIQADTYLYVDGGTYNVTTTGEFVSYSSENKTLYDLDDDDYKFIKQNNSYVRIAKDSNYSYSQRYALTQSTKGFKVGNIEYDTDGDDEDDTEIEEGNYSILLQNGTFNITSTDDAIHTNSGNTYINGGTYTISTYDDAITSDLFTIINDGEITITTSYEGFEGTYVYVNGGDIEINSTDDGINASSDDKSINPYIIINDGDIDCNAGGDAFDSNGTLVINDGNIKLYGTVNNDDNLLDSDKGTLINGGTLIGVGKSGMLEYPGKNSSNNIIYYFPSTTLESNTSIEIKDASNNVIYSSTTPSSDQLIIISSPEIKLNTTYYLYTNNTLIGSFTPSQAVTVLGNYNGGQGNRPGEGERPRNDENPGDGNIDNPGDRSNDDGNGPK